jgi:adenine-specific DNA glycosylase
MVEKAPSESDFAEAWGRSFGGVPSEVESLGSVRHLFSHRKLQLEVFRVEAEGRGEGDGAWIELELIEKLALSKLTEKVWSLVARQGPI